MHIFSWRVFSLPLMEKRSFAEESHCLCFVYCSGRRNKEKSPVFKWGKAFQMFLSRRWDFEEAPKLCFLFFIVSRLPLSQLFPFTYSLSFYWLSVIIFFLFCCSFSHCLLLSRLFFWVHTKLCVPFHKLRIYWFRH